MLPARECAEIAEDSQVTAKTAKGGQIGRDSVDESRLLDGEQPDSPYPDDAAHWANTYAELIEMKTALLATIEDRMGSLTEPARIEVQNTDRKLVMMELQRFQKRMEFWRQRLAELTNSTEA